MSAFNTITATVECSKCGRCSDFEVQFKYGDTWQHTYNVGQRLRWGGNDVGIAGHKRVLVEGIGGPCRFCGADNVDFDVVVQEDVLVQVLPVRGGRALSSEGGFLVIED